MFHAGYVAIMGAPNVGKSTLMNSMLDQKLAITSSRAQTTRHRILGILNGSDHQVIFLDTPGIIEPKYVLQEVMMKTAQRTMRGADLILLIIDAVHSRTIPCDFMEQLKALSVPVFLCVNKVDLADKNNLLPVMESHDRMHLFQEIVPVSALKHVGLDVLKELIIKALPAGEPFYPQDMISDEPERFFVAELIREQIYTNYGEEIPYSSAVLIEEFIERPGRKDFVHAVIHVERDSQKGILIGKGGRSLKKTGRLARENIELFLGRPVFLQLDVRVRKKWRRDESQVRRLGYG